MDHQNEEQAQAFRTKQRSEARTAKAQRRSKRRIERSFDAIESQAKLEDRSKKQTEYEKILLEDTPLVLTAGASSHLVARRTAMNAVLSRHRKEYQNYLYRELVKEDKA